MTDQHEVTVTGAAYWVGHPNELARRLASGAATIRDPEGWVPQTDDVMYFTQPHVWAASAIELGDVLRFAAGSDSAEAGHGPRGAAGVVAPVENRLVYTVEEAATLLGISRSFAYEAVQNGQIPSMRIGRRILVPKAALERFLAAQGTSEEPE